MNLLFEWRLNIFCYQETFFLYQKVATVIVYCLRTFDVSFWNNSLTVTWCIKIFYLYNKLLNWTINWSGFRALIWFSFIYYLGLKILVWIPVYLPHRRVLTQTARQWPWGSWDHLKPLVFYLLTNLEHILVEHILQENLKESSIYWLANMRITSLLSGCCCAVLSDMCVA